MQIHFGFNLHKNRYILKCWMKNTSSKHNLGHRKHNQIKNKTNTKKIWSLPVKQRKYPINVIKEDFCHIGNKKSSSQSFHVNVRLTKKYVLSKDGTTKQVKYYLLEKCYKSLSNTTLSHTKFNTFLTWIIHKAFNSKNGNSYKYIKSGYNFYH